MPAGEGAVAYHLYTKLKPLPRVIVGSEFQLASVLTDVRLVISGVSGHLDGFFFFFYLLFPRDKKESLERVGG